MRPIFVGGCERSETTLLAALLTGHGEVIAPPEAQFYLEELAASRLTGSESTAIFGEFVANYWRFWLWGLPRALPTEPALASSRPSDVMANLTLAYAKRVSDKDADRWVDHTPLNVGYASTLLAEFNSVPMIHIVRDPRALVASMLPLDWGPSSARAGARWWLSRIAMGLVAKTAFPERVVRVRYANLVHDPSGSLKRLCPLVGLTFESTMVDAGDAQPPSYTQSQHALVRRPPDPTHIEAWRSSLSDRDVAVIEGKLGDVPAMLGYGAVAAAPAITHVSSAREFFGKCATDHPPATAPPCSDLVWS